MLRAGQDSRRRDYDPRSDPRQEGARKPNVSALIQLPGTSSNGIGSRSHHV